MIEESTHLQGLRALMAEHGLSQSDVATLACVSKKTVESWLASPGSVMRRTFHKRHLACIHFNLSAFQRRAALKKKESKK